LNRILPLFSYIFHPVFIPLFGTLSFFVLAPHYLNLTQQFLVCVQVSILTIFIPISIYLLLKTIGKIDTIMVGKVSQRRLPLLIQSILLFLLISQSITIDKIPELYFFFLAGLASTLAALAFSLLKVKASLHMMGIASLTVFAFVLSILYQSNAIILISLLVLANGLIASSRLQMKAHSETELALGFICGMLPQIAIGYVYLYL
jgi:hypothetical protein